MSMTKKWQIFESNELSVSLHYAFYHASFGILLSMQPFDIYLWIARANLDIHEKVGRSHLSVELVECHQA